MFAAEEDFGITPVEAQACGTPVIAFGKGGSLETIRPYGVNKPTGVFFAEQTVPSLIDAINLFENIFDKITPKIVEKTHCAFPLTYLKIPFQSILTRNGRSLMLQKNSILNILESNF